MILSKITIGSILLLEVDADPSNVLNPTPAPVGSEAYFNDAGVGKTYLKFGAGDNDWTAYQTGSEPSDWKFTTDANQLNVASAKAYFGTKAGSNFDIEFQRNGVAKVTIASSDFKIHSDLTFVDTSSAYIRHNTGSINIEANNTIGLKGNTVNENINNRHQRYFRNGGGSPVAFEINEFKTDTIPDASADFTTSFADQAVGSHRLVKAELHYFNGAGDSMILEKSVHINSLNQIVVVQDDFTSKSSALSSVQCVVSYAGGQVEFALSGLPAGTAKRVSLFVSEKSKF